jgi:diguanylate cyclase (GGDEF)-like protein/PAS domain S-box-containing protein
MAGRDDERRAGAPVWAGRELEFVRAVLDTLSDHVYVKDRDGRYLLLNRAGLRERGLDSPEQIVGKTAYDIFPAALAERLSAEDRAVMESGEPLVNREARTRFLGVPEPSEPRWHITSKTPLRDPGGEVVGLVGINRDITKRKLAELALRDSEQTFRAIFDQAAVGITVTSPELRYLEANNRFCEMIGYAREELLAMGLRDVKPPHLREEASEYRQQLLSGGAPGHELRETQLLRKDGTTLWVGLATSLVRGANGEPRYFISVIQDVSQAKRAEAALRESEERFRQLAHIDPLTQLPNRALFCDRLAQSLAQAERNNGIVGVMFLDVDRFKPVNDRLGHAAGDALLYQLAARLQRAVRSGDTVARYGGDEFAVALSSLAAPQDAGLVAQKIVAALGEPFLIEGEQVIVSASVGIALSPLDGSDQETLLKQADAAMYSAKAAGRDCYRFYRPEMNARALELLALGSQLRGAFERRELMLRYQPRFALTSGAATGLEALLTWEHPELGVIGHRDLLPLLEDTGLLALAGSHALDAACAQIRQWQRDGLGPQRVAVKLSARQFLAPSLVSVVSRLIGEHRIEPSLLEISVSEASVIANLEAAIEAFAELRSIGLRLAIDDFATGYTSLSALRRLPIGSLRIDRSLVTRLPGDPDAAAISGAAIALAHGLGLSALADGVDGEAQLAFLAGHGCDEAQGERFSAPIVAAALGEWLQRGAYAGARRA